MCTMSKLTCCLKVCSSLHMVLHIDAGYAVAVRPVHGGEAGSVAVRLGSAAVYRFPVWR